MALADRRSTFNSGLRHFGTSTLRRFTSALRDFDTLMLRHFDASTLRDFDTCASTLGLQRFGTLALWCFDGWDLLRHFGTSAASGVSCTSHFETPEAYFPEHLDQLPPVPLKINDLCSLRAFFSGAILRAILDS
jgi:hypothetical protein